MSGQGLKSRGLGVSNRSLCNSLFRVLAEAFYVLGLWQIMLFLEQRFGRRHHVVVLLYHNVTSPENAEFVSELGLGMPVSTFDMQVCMFTRWYRPLKSAELIDYLNGIARLDQDGVMITFDDGYKNIRSVAQPILERWNAPSMVFIATEYVESSRRFWWVRLDDIMLQISPEAWNRLALQFKGPFEVRNILDTMAIGDWQSRVRIREELRLALRGLTSQDQHSVLDRFDEFVPVRDTCLPTLNWTDILDMREHGFEFGAHTHTHANLLSLSPSEVHQELVRCINQMEAVLGHRPRAFAYPYGNHNDSVAGEVQNAGLELAFGCESGVVNIGAVPRYLLPRIQLYRWSRGEVAATIVALKLGKYFPNLMQPVIRRLVA